ncbi:MAG: cupin domain-containing protein [Chloroflexota bacterium]|nr:cupin domain-containing protein [Chloroflexota bacterium]
MVRYVYQPGSVFPKHSHVQEQITVVLSGYIRFTVGDERIECGPGSCAVIPGGMPHGAEVIGDQVVETLNALSPRRETSPDPSPGCCP